MDRRQKKQKIIIRNKKLTHIYKGRYMVMNKQFNLIQSKKFLAVVT